MTNQPSGEEASERRRGLAVMRILPENSWLFLIINRLCNCFAFCHVILYAIELQ